MGGERGVKTYDAGSPKAVGGRWWGNVDFFLLVVVVVTVKVVIVFVVIIIVIVVDMAMVKA